MQAVFGLLAVEFGGPQVDQDQVHVGAAADHADAGLAGIGLQQPVGQDFRAGERALLALAERRLGGGDLNATALAAMTCSRGRPADRGRPRS